MVGSVDNHQSDDTLTRTNGTNNHDKNKNVETRRRAHFAKNEEMEVYGYAPSKLKSLLCLVFHTITLGLTRLLFHWRPTWHLKATHVRCDLEMAEKVLIKDDYNGKTASCFVKKVQIIGSKNPDGIKNGTNKSGESFQFRLVNGEKKELSQIRIIRFKKMTYIWDDYEKHFIRLAGLENGISRNELHEMKGQTTQEQEKKRSIYGYNEIVTPDQTVLTLIALESLTPFYIFQLFSLAVWTAERYYYYGIAIVIMSVVGITTAVIQTRKNQTQLKGTVNFSSVAMVNRGNGIYEEIPSRDLVPGDVIILPANGCEMFCDAVLLSGSCIVNESMLTGESIPVMKTSLDHHNTAYNFKEDVNHTLFCGTAVLQSKSHGDHKVSAVVIRTGFLTAKGELIRSILYPPPADFKFDRDSYKYLGILAFIALLGTIYTIVSKITRSITPVDILIKSLDVITIVIPPALPAAMTIGKLYAIRRLKQNGIYCVNSRVINVSGSVDCICFDKTGTLTEDSLELWAVVPVCENTKSLGEPVRDITQISRNSELFLGMATCHSLTKIDNQVQGDPLDVKMFEATKWILEDNHILGKCYGQHTPSMIVRDDKMINSEFGIIKQFQFSPSLQRMSVIIKTPDPDPEVNQLKVMCKGSPEMVISLSTKSSVPQDTFVRLKEYTEKGYRVIGLASKIINTNLTQEQVNKLHRTDVEQNLNFIGLLILENPLKPQTTTVIKSLKLATSKIAMITGDNIQTAVTVARECQIIDHDCRALEVMVEKPGKSQPATLIYRLLSKQKQSIQQFENTAITDIESGKRPYSEYCFVISGENWANAVQYFPDMIPKIVIKCAVFARMSGIQKQQVIEELKTLGYYTAMCGDGANDCGALRAAHVGISLSEAESSVASAFTSTETNISCVPNVIKEGRAALVTSFGVFQIMLCYSLTEFTSVIILYGIDNNLGSMQFLFIDIFLVLFCTASFGRTKAYPLLAREAPRTSLLGLIPIFSMLAFMLLAIISQVTAYQYIQTFDWFVPYNHSECKDEVTWFCTSYENYAVFATSTFQYLTLFIIFSKGKPYRKSILTNKILLCSIFLMTAICLYMILYPAKWLVDLMELQMPPAMEGRYSFIVIGLCTFILCYAMQKFVIEVKLEKICASRFSKNKKQYLAITKTMRYDSIALSNSNEFIFNKSKYKVENSSNGFDNGSFLNDV